MSHEKQKVSVVIPCFNSLKYIPYTLESIFKQTFSCFEIIIVDDGSTYPIEDYISEINQPNIRYFYINHSGVAAAKNFGIKKSKGDIIAFLDSDDLWLPKKIESQIDEMTVTDLPWSSTYSEDFSSETGKTILTVKSKYRGEGLFDALLLRNFICNSSVLMKRSLFEEIGYFDETISFGEDWELWLRAAVFHQIAFVPNILVKRRIHSDSITHLSSVQSRLKQKIRILKNFSNKKLIDKKRAILFHGYYYYRGLKEFLSSIVKRR